MGDVGSCRNIGGTTLACLITEQATFDADHDGHAQASASHLLKAEGALHNQPQHLRYHVDVHDDDNQSQDEIADGHDGHHDTAHTGNAVYAAESDKQRYRSDDASHHQRIEAEGLVQCAADGIALDGVIGETKGQRDEHGKQSRHPLVVHAAADVIGRASDERVT